MNKRSTIIMLYVLQMEKKKMKTQQKNEHVPRDEYYYANSTLVEEIIGWRRVNSLLCADRHC